jgi:apolipoprotein N-acyltransferase
MFNMSGKSLGVKLLLACLAGISLTFAYAPFSLWFISIIAVSGFIYILSQSPIKHSFRLGFSFGLGWFGAGISWVHVSIADYGGLPLIGSVGLMLLLSAYLALFPAFISYIISQYFPTRLWPLALPFIWLVFEWIRSWFLTGFPWLSIGYSQISGGLTGWFAVIGEFGVTSLVVLWCTAVAIWLPNKQWISAAGLSVLLLVSATVLDQQQWAKPTGEVVNISMVQGNITQDLRWTPEQDQPTMSKYQNMTADHWQSDVIIWPEAAIPKIEPAAQSYLHKMDQLAASKQTGLITGIVNVNFETRQAFNNLIGLGLKEAPSLAQQTNTDQLGHYSYLHQNRFSKHHLLPIGEFIPFESWLRGLAPIFDLPMSSFSRGEYRQKNLQAKGNYFAPAMCFEIAFPKQIAANLYPHTDFIITVSNDAWFGDSHGPAQHLEIAQVRAKEFGLPVIRATNNGISAFIDHRGVIQSQLPQFVAAVLTDNIQKVTGYTPYRRFGDWPIWFLSCLSFGFGYWLKKSH